MKKNNKLLLGLGLLLPLAMACSPSVSAFAHEKLKGLAEQLQKSMPAPNKSGGGNQPSSEPAMKNFQSGPNAKSGNSGKLGFCDDEVSGFNTSSAKSFNVGDPEALVKQYFNVDSTTATVQLRSYLFDNRSEVIGTSFPEAMIDGGIFSGQSRALGVQLIRDPSISSLAQVIAAAGQQKKGFAKPDLQVYESKAVFALVALQLEPLLKQRGVIESMLKESRNSGQFGGTEVKSPFAYALSARFELIKKNNGQGFDTFLGSSRVNQGAELEAGELINRGCQMCERTTRWAAATGFSNGIWAQRRQQGEQLLAKLDEGKVPFNNAAWVRAYEQTVAERDRLDGLVLSSFTQAKTQSRTTSAGLEQARKSAELLKKYGMEEDPAVTRAGSILALDTPKFADAEKKAALNQALRDRLKLIDQARRLYHPLRQAHFSGDYSITDLGQKGRALQDLANSACLVAFAQEQAAAASEVAFPDPKDNQAEDEFMRQ